MESDDFRTRPNQDFALERLIDDVERHPANASKGFHIEGLSDHRRMRRIALRAEGAAVLADHSVAVRPEFVHSLEQEDRHEIEAGAVRQAVHLVHEIGRPLLDRAEDPGPRRESYNDLGGRRAVFAGQIILPAQDDGMDLPARGGSVSSPPFVDRAAGTKDGAFQESLHVVPFGPGWSMAEPIGCGRLGFPLRPAVPLKHRLHVWSVRMRIDRLHKAAFSGTRFAQSRRVPSTAKDASEDLLERAQSRKARAPPFEPPGSSRKTGASRLR